MQRRPGGTAYYAGMGAGADLDGMFGRSDALAELSALASGAQRGRGAVAIVRGEAGIGESTLGAAVASHVHGIGLTPVWGW